MIGKLSRFLLKKNTKIQNKNISLVPSMKGSFIFTKIM